MVHVDSSCGVIRGGRWLVAAAAQIQHSGRLVEVREDLSRWFRGASRLRDGVRRRFLRFLEQVLGDRLYENNAVVLLPPNAQLQIHFTLNIHEDDAAGEADGHDDELGPEGPFDEARLDLVGGALDEHVEGPDDARDRDQVERHRAHDLALLHAVHVQLFPLLERAHFRLHDEVELAELARLHAVALEPLLQAALVHVAQGARAVARRYEVLLARLLAVADATHERLAR